MGVRMIGRRAIFVAVAVLAISACSRGEPETAFASSSTRASNSTAQHAVTPASVNDAALRLVLASTGNAARYRVRERLMGHDFDNDAIGETKNLTGAISFDSNGKVIRDVSKFTVDAGSFVSDKNRRDGFVRGRLLEADEYPMVVLVPTTVRGMTIPLPTTGSRTFEMTGDGGGFASRYSAFGLRPPRGSSQTIFLSLLPKSERQGGVTLWYCQSTCVSVSQAAKQGEPSSCGAIP